jgi:hypothetical protein
MTGIVYGFVRAGSAGWSDPATLIAFVAGAALLGGFLLIEARAEQPIMALRLFARLERSGAYIGRLPLSACPGPSGTGSASGRSRRRS